MKLGIMQPYFFPYIGYFDLIHSVDQWVVFDTPQYIRHGWINRNRILHPTAGWQHIIAPVRKHRRAVPIGDIRVVEDGDWRALIPRQIEHYRGRAPHFEAVAALVQDCLRSPEPSLARLNVQILEKVCAMLEIQFAPRYFSAMNLPLGAVDGPGDWALRIAEALGADEYVNPPGGIDLFDASKFAASGIRLTMQRRADFTYECRGYRFEAALSIVDVLMWNSVEQIRAFLDGRRRTASS
jgi:WbqC-like protein